MIQVSEQEKWPVKFCSITIAKGRIDGAAEMRNPAPPATILHRSRAVRGVVVEAVIQQWADDDR